MSEGLFRKTESGQAELRQRSAGLAPRERTLLILANGQLGVDELTARLGFDPREALQRLLAFGLLEPAPTPLRVPPRPAPAPPAPPAPPPQTHDLDAARRRALPLLAPHYGPDAPRIAAELLAARDETAFDAALKDLQNRLGAAMGRRMAADLVRRIAPWWP